MGLLEFTKIYPTKLLTIIIPLIFFVMIFAVLVYLIKSKEWSAVICMGYIITLFLLILWITYKINLGEFNFMDYGICFIFFLFSVFIFKLIAKFFFWVRIINQSVARVKEATVKGLNKFGLPIIKQKDAGKDQIVIVAYDPKVYETEPIIIDAHSSEDRLRIAISIKELAQYSTEIRIRVGVFGNIKRSREISEAIESYLK